MKPVPSHIVCLAFDKRMMVLRGQDQPRGRNGHAVLVQNCDRQVGTRCRLRRGWREIGLLLRFGRLGSGRARSRRGMLLRM